MVESLEARGFGVGMPGYDREKWGELCRLALVLCMQACPRPCSSIGTRIPKKSCLGCNKGTLDDETSTYALAGSCHSTRSGASSLRLLSLLAKAAPLPSTHAGFDLDGENKAKGLILWKLQSPHVRAFHVSAKRIRRSWTLNKNVKQTSLGNFKLRLISPCLTARICSPAAVLDIVFHQFCGRLCRGCPAPGRASELGLDCVRHWCIRWGS
eukprot:1136171-Pelagomonas_calceolata.AAC.1